MKDGAVPPSFALAGRPRRPSPHLIQETLWILRPISDIVGTAPSWHNVKALADCGTGKKRCFLGVSSGPHGFPDKHFCAHQQPAAQRADRLPDVRLRPPAPPGAGVVFSA